MLTNQHREADLPALLDLELPDGEAAEIVEHLRMCEECRRGLVEAVAGLAVPLGCGGRRRPKSAKRVRRARKKPSRTALRPTSQESRRTRYIDAAFAALPVLVIGVILLIRVLSPLL